MSHTIKKPMELIKEKKICVEGQHEGNFFENVFAQMMQKSYLREETVQRIQVQLINLWTEQIQAFNQGKSSSISEQNAKKLLESVYFTLGFRLRALEDLDESIDLLEHQPLKTLFEEGQKLIEEQYEVLKQDYKRLSMQLLPTENIAYRDTYDKGLAPFFSCYAPVFESQECPASIDYPLSNDRMEQVGIWYMMDYVQKSLLEHSLCLKFKMEEVEGLLEGYHQGYRDLLINIYELVLMNAIGRLLSGQDLESLRLEVQAVERIEKTLEILPTHLLEKTLVEKGLEVLEQLGLDSLEMRAYTLQTLHKYAARVEQVLEDEALSTVFIVTAKDDQDKVQYQGGKRLSNREFKAVTEKIRACIQVEDKFKWIQEKVQHVEDLRDVLEADCIFGEEYVELYRRLEDIEVGVLLNLVRVDENDETEIEIDKEWFTYLKQYLYELSEERRARIQQLSTKIQQ